MKKGETPAQDRINKQQFESMCHIHCSKEEIASIFNVDADTLNTWCKKTYGDTFSVIYKKYADGGKMSLRRYQFRLAEKNPAMAIWLGKQYLNQRDRQEIVAEVDNKNNYKDLSLDELKKLAGE